MNFHYVTGLHRAGTHSIAENMAKDLNLPYIEESEIGVNDFDNAVLLTKGIVQRNNPMSGNVYVEKRPELKEGFVCQCPFLAHKSINLSKIGDVYWCKRDKLSVVTSMRNGNFELFSWRIMNDFHNEFPADPIWDALTYDGNKDVFDGFINHYSLLLRVKEYFLNTKFKNVVKIIKLEQQSFYDTEKALTSKKPLKDYEMGRLLL